MPMKGWPLYPRVQMRAFQVPDTTIRMALVPRSCGLTFSSSVEPPKASFQSFGVYGAGAFCQRFFTRARCPFGVDLIGGP